MDYRDTLSALIPMIITIIIFLGFLVGGFFWGYKRSLYWGLGNWFFLLIGLLIFTIFKTEISEGLVSITASIMLTFNPSMTASELSAMTPIIIELAGPIIYLICFVIGNIILGILWAAVFKRLFKLSKKTKIKHSKRYKIMSSASGVAIAFVLFTPITANLGQIVYATTTSQKNIDSNEASAGLYNIVNAVFEANPVKYYSNPMVSIDSFSASLKMFNNPDQLEKIIGPISEIITGSLKDPDSDPAVLREELNNILNDAATVEQLEIIFKSSAMTESFTNVIKENLPVDKVSKEDLTKIVTEMTKEIEGSPSVVGTINVPQASYDILKTFIASNVVNQSTFEGEEDMNIAIEAIMGLLFIKL